MAKYIVKKPHPKFGYVAGDEIDDLPEDHEVLLEDGYVIEASKVKKAEAPKVKTAEAPKAEDKKQ